MCIRDSDADIAQAPDTLRDVLGYLPQDFGVYPHLTALEFLEYMAAVKGPVSYTHLDVYKRQAEGALAHQSAGKLAHAREPPRRTRNTVSGLAGVPVSYTHLDVYKRQR